MKGRVIIAAAAGMFLVLFFNSQPVQAATTVTGNPGLVRLFMVTSGATDPYTSFATALNQQWIASHFWRMNVFSPYWNFSWDNKLTWFPNAWLYTNGYAIYTSDTATVTSHPDWILRDSNGNPLYIQWACGGGTCPQYAADISNPSFRTWWIQNAQSALGIGYKGLFIDDVNMEWKISDNNGNGVCNDGNNSGSCPTVMDSITGQPMTLTNWRKYFAQFLQQVRTALPHYEIIHNALWFAGGTTGTSDPYIAQQIAAADYQLIEHGFDDGGLTGGTGYWSLANMWNRIDFIHSVGKGAIFGDTHADLASEEYALANYYLVSAGSDAVGIDSGSNFLNAYWTGYDTDLGTPLGARYTWNGLSRRDFQNGFTLVDDPGGPTKTVALPGNFKRTDGSVVSTIAMSPSHGAILLNNGAPITVNTLSPSSIMAQAGSTITLTYSFSGGPATSSYVVFTHLDNGAAVYSVDNSYPPVLTTQWSAPYTYTHQITIPSNVPTGTWPIRIGFYDPVNLNGARMALTPGPGVVADNQLRYIVGSVTVVAPTVVTVPTSTPPAPTSTPPAPTSTPPIPTSTPPAATSTPLPIPTSTPIVIPVLPSSSNPIPTPPPVSNPVPAPASGGGGGGGGGGFYSYVPPTPQATTTQPGQTIPTVFFPRTLQIGSTGADVQLLQVTLKSLGFLPTTLTPTTYFGTLTQHALIVFQNQHQLTKSGMLDVSSEVLLNKILANLYGTTATTLASNTSGPSATFLTNFGPGARSADVTALQKLLIRDGDYPAAIVTGYYGALTIAAVQQLQIKYGIVSGGSPYTNGFGAVGPKTRAKLNTL
jgi:peptidoglycan hydrolase-like protein with peptidoglycan-binding domain